MKRRIASVMTTLARTGVYSTGQLVCGHSVRVTNKAKEGDLVYCWKCDKAASPRGRRRSSVGR